MPVGEAWIDHRVEPLGPPRVRDVEDDPIAGASPCGEFARGKDSDVVALVRPPRLLGVLAMGPALPKTGKAAGCSVSEHRRAIDDPGPRRIAERDLDHVDAEESGAVVTRNLSDAALEFFSPCEPKTCPKRRR